MTNSHAVRHGSALVSFAALSVIAACGAPSHNTANDSDSKVLELGGTRLSPGQVAYHLRNAGFPEHAIGVMVCIAKYESSFYTGAINHNSGGTTDYGLFQINSYYWGSACGVSGSQLMDPVVNARCALRVYREQGYNAWYGYQYNRGECNGTGAPGSAGPGGGGGGSGGGGQLKIAKAVNKLYSGTSRQAAFCSNLPVGTPVTVHSSHGNMYDVTVPQGKCIDWKGVSQTRGFLDTSVVK